MDIENLNGEIEKKISSKYEIKLKEYEKKIKIFDSEYNELKYSLDNFENKQKKLSEQVSNLQEKEKDYLNRSKDILEDKKINLEKLKDLKAEITQKCSKIENYVRELDNVLLTEKENVKDKENFVNNYINEMNSLLDYYEQKSGKISIKNYNLIYFLDELAKINKNWEEAEIANNEGNLFFNLNSIINKNEIYQNQIKKEY